MWIRVVATCKNTIQYIPQRNLTFFSSPCRQYWGLNHVTSPNATFFIFYSTASCMVAVVRIWAFYSSTHHGDDTHLDLWLICWHLHQVGPDKEATPAGVTQLAKCKHGYSRPGEPAPRLHTPVAGHPWAPRFDIVRAYPLRPLTGNNTAPAAAPAKRKSLHLDSLKLLASSKSICCAEDVTSLFNFLKFFHREATSSKMRNQAR